MQEIRRGSYTGIIPVIIPHPELAQSLLEGEPNRKMINPSVTKYRRAHGEIQYVIHIEYLEGKNWEVIKSDSEIVTYRRKVSRKHQHLKIPIISQEGDIKDPMIWDKRKYEIQAFLDYMRNSKVWYKALLDLIEFKKNWRSVSEKIKEPEESLAGSSASKQSNKVSEVSINYHDEGPAQVLGDSFQDPNNIFSASPNEGSLEDSDEEL